MGYRRHNYKPVLPDSQPRMIWNIFLCSLTSVLMILESCLLLCTVKYPWPWLATNLQNLYAYTLYCPPFNIKGHFPHWLPNWSWVNFRIHKIFLNCPVSWNFSEWNKSMKTTKHNMVNHSTMKTGWYCKLTVSKFQNDWIFVGGKKRVISQGFWGSP